MRLIFLYIILVFFCASTASAQDISPIILDVAQEQVSITAGFDGAKVVVFGTASPQDQITITLKGPPRNMIVRRKKNILGMWLNAVSQEFRNIPSYYSYAISAPDMKIKVGLDTLDLPGAESVSSLQQRDFQDALIRNLQAQNLYATDAVPVLRPGGHLFRAEFNLPHNTPIGAFTLEATAYRENVIIGRTQRVMRVIQTGVTGQIQNFALDYSFAYALSGLIIALMAGLGSFFLSRRDI